MSKPRERAIIFSAESVRAIMDRRKTQTRRVVKSQPQAYFTDFHWTDDGYVIWSSENIRGFSVAKPRYRVGDRLYIKETWAALWPDEEPRPIEECNIEYKADTNEPYPGGWPAEEARGNPDAPKWRSPIHMPRWASRINLTVCSVGVERLQDISDKDAIAEGFDLDYWYDFRDAKAWPCPVCHGWGVYPRVSYSMQLSEESCTNCDAPTKMFRLFWDALNAKRGHGWDKNDWVWIYYFEVCDEAP